MDLAAFRTSVAHDNAPPAGLPAALVALWWAGRGDWHRAHAATQNDDSADVAWVHAHLHREEGDLSNAAYWYRRAGRAECGDTLEAEWEAIAAELLGRR